MLFYLYCSRADGPAFNAPRIKIERRRALDPAVLAEICGGDPSAEREILSHFRRVNDSEAVKMREAVTTTDLALVTHVAHSMKGSSQMVGAGELANVCARTERASREADWQTIMAKMDAFEHAIDRVNSYIDLRVRPSAPALAEVR